MSKSYKLPSIIEGEIVNGGGAAMGVFSHTPSKLQTRSRCSPFFSETILLLKLISVCFLVLDENSIFLPLCCLLLIK